MKTVAIFLGCRKETGGMFQYARTVLHALAEGNHPEYRVLAISPPGTEWGPICEGFGVEWVEISHHNLAQRVAGKLVRMSGEPGARRRRLMSRVTPLGLALNNNDVDLVIYTEYEHYSYELDTPSLVPIHDLMHRYESRFSENRLFTNPDALFSKICNGAYGILVDSAVGEEQVRESYGPFEAQVFTLPYIPPDYVYDSSLLDPDPEVEGLLSQLPERFLFYPAQFWEHKNHCRLIEAMMGLVEQYPDLHLALAGSRKNHYDSVVRCIEALGAGSRVTMLGYVSDAAKLELYRAATALVMPTFYGPTNIPPLEAFELGCPVATSAIYGVPEQLGDAALLFDPASTEEIRDSIGRLWGDEDLRRELVERGRRHAAQWGPEQFAERLHSIVTASLQDVR